MLLYQNVGGYVMRFRKFINVLLVTLVFLLFPDVFGQAELIKFKHLTHEDGLSQNWVGAILRDSYGYMWFGTTNNGLNRYDGTNFTVYKNDPSEPASISHNTINTIFEDRSRNLWVGTNYGLNKYNRKLDRFEVIPRFRNTYIEAVFERSDNRLYLVNSYDIRLYDPEIDSLDFIFNGGDTPLEEYFHTGILRLDENTVVFTTKRGLLQLDETSNSLVPLTSPGEPDLNSIDVRCIYSDSKGRIWVGTGLSGLYCIEIDPEKKQVRSCNHYHNSADAAHKLTGGAVLAIAEDNNENLWISIENGGIHLIPIGESVEHIGGSIKLTTDVINNYSLSDNSTNTLYRDFEGTIWVGTYSRGIDYYNRAMYKFDHYRRSQREGTSINNDHVNVILDEPDKLWIGTEQGLNMFDKQKGNWKYFIHDEDNPTSISSNAVWSLLRDQSGRFWVGTWAGGLNLLNESTGTFTRYQHKKTDASSISNNNVFAIIEFYRRL